MSSVAVNNPVSPSMVIQERGNQPVETGEIQQQEFAVWKFTVFGCIQIGLGAALGILSLVGMILDAFAMHDIYEDYLNDGHLDYRNTYRVLLVYDIICLICFGG